MARIIFLDSGPLGLACQGLGNDKSLDFKVWMLDEATGGSVIVIPEIADYEVRRSLLENELGASVARLTDLRRYPAVYLPINTASMERAAGLWAQARRKGRSTSGEKSLDGDVILSAQALEYCSDADDWWVATDNAKHLSRYVGGRAQPWRRIQASRYRK